MGNVHFRITYTEVAKKHLRGLTARQRSLVLDTVDEQLAHQPMVETRNRKPMRPNPWAPWELRIGDLRVYYSFAEGESPETLIHAVGVKVRDRLFLAGEETELP
jgi:mRNA-degrading endonuclease RelE of RelBE toxin-antitoxin system